MDQFENPVFMALCSRLSLPLDKGRGIPALSTSKPMKAPRLLSLLLSMLCIGAGAAQSWYTGETPLRRVTVQNGVLTDCNSQADSCVINTTATGINPGEGVRPAITLDIANLHNRTGRRYEVFTVDSAGQTLRQKVENPVWGVVWGYRDPQNHHGLLLRAGADDFYGYQAPEWLCTIYTVARGDTIFHTRWKRVASNSIHPGSDYNRLHIVPVSGGYEILLGPEQEFRLGVCRDDRLFGNQAGIRVGSGACVCVKNWTVTPREYPERHVIWSADELDELLRQSHHPAEGFYEFLQASATNSYTRLGGNYRLAMVSSGPHFLLIYVEGAQRFGDQWQTGMVKAVLEPTGLSNLFNVTWYDAEHRPIREGVKAIIGDNGVLTIHFSREGVILEWNRAIGPDGETGTGNRGSYHATSSLTPR